MVGIKWLTSKGYVLLEVVIFYQKTCPTTGSKFPDYRHCKCTCREGKDLVNTQNAWMNVMLECDLTDF